VKGEVVDADEAGLIDDGTRNGRHAGHGGERAGEQTEGNAATADAAVLVVGGCDRAMMPEAGFRRPMGSSEMRAGRARELTWGGCRMAEGAGDWAGRNRADENEAGGGASQVSWWTTRWKRGGPASEPSMLPTASRTDLCAVAS
jgi:hypothetical protein